MMRKAMTVMEILVAARALIGVREHWCIGTLAETKLGRHTDPCSPAARSWCAVGALTKVNRWRHGAELLAARELLDAAAEGLFGRSAASVNDYLGYAYVMQIYEAAIAAAHKLEDAQ